MESSSLSVRFCSSLFIFREFQYRRRGCEGPSRVSEAEHDLDQSESLQYVRTLGIILCSCVMESSSLSVREIGRASCRLRVYILGDEGAREIAESSKQNWTLTVVDLYRLV